MNCKQGKTVSEKVFFHCRSRDMWDVIGCITGVRASSYDERYACRNFEASGYVGFSGREWSRKGGYEEIDLEWEQKILDNMTKEEIKNFKAKLKGEYHEKR